MALIINQIFGYQHNDPDMMRHLECPLVPKVVAFFALELRLRTEHSVCSYTTNPVSRSLP